MPSITALQAAVGRLGFSVAVVLVLAVGLSVVARLRRREALRTAALATCIGLAVAVAGVLSLTLFGWEAPGEAPRRLILDPLEGAWGWDSIAWRPVYDNVALFVPLGALASATWWRRSQWSVWLGCVMFSTAVEAFQYLLPTGRVANMADVLANATGALLGIALAGLVGARRQPAARPRSSNPMPTSTSRR